MKRRFKTKEEFIESVMNGDVWELKWSKFYYDISMNNPFRVNSSPMSNTWSNVTKEEFTLVESEPVMEKRWKMLKDCDGYTKYTDAYYNQTEIDGGLKESYGWYKGDFIEVEIKG